MNPIRALRILAVAGVAAAVAGAGLTAIRGNPPPVPGAAASSTPPSVTTPSANPAPSVSPTRSAPGPGGLMPTSEPIASSSCGEAKATKLVRLRVEVDRAVGVEPATFAAAVASVICDERSWISSERVRFRYDPAGKLLIGLRTPDGAERRCLRLIRLSVNRRWSCGTPREVVINSARWKGGSEPWPGPLAEYRRMLMNHEVGHALGLHHQNCPSDGAAAPVMMQQSKGMTSPNGRTCKPNPWPLSSEIARLR